LVFIISLLSCMPSAAVWQSCAARVAARCSLRLASTGARKRVFLGLAALCLCADLSSNPAQDAKQEVIQGEKEAKKVCTDSSPNASDAADCTAGLAHIYQRPACGMQYPNPVHCPSQH
jgi:hypothetical protein